MLPVRGKNNLDFENINAFYVLRHVAYYHQNQQYFFHAYTLTVFKQSCILFNMQLEFIP